jgi:prepilin-type N-terminal cleavage/methylation domain-containing protein
MLISPCIEELLTVAIRPPQHSLQGYTLIEMITVVGIVSIVVGFAVPSLLSLNKPLRDGVSQLKSHLSLVRSKAISSGKSYRIKPMSVTRSDYKESIPRNFIVEYADSCAATTGWQRASQFDLDLPEKIGITDVDTTLTIPPSTTEVTVSNDLNWNSGEGLCFDNRGIVSKTLRFVVKDFQGFGAAQIALFDITKVGGIEAVLYDKNNNNVSSY